MKFLLIGNYLPKLRVPCLKSRFLLEAGCEPYRDGLIRPFLGEPRLQKFQFHLESILIDIIQDIYRSQNRLTCLPPQSFLYFLGRECCRAWFEYGKFRAE